MESEEFWNKILFCIFIFVQSLKMSTSAPKTWKKLNEGVQNKRFIDTGIKNQQEEEEKETFEDPLEIITSSEPTSNRSTKYRQKLWDLAQFTSENPSNGLFFKLKKSKKNFLLQRRILCKFLFVKCS
jgi:hypothetical protein